MEFIDLNKSSSKDIFPLTRINKLMHGTTRNDLLCFMDAYLGYKQIPMYEPDQEHNSFVTYRGLYYYIGVPLILINVGVTYQRLANMMFREHFGKTMKVYHDDILVKSKIVYDHIRYLDEIFGILRIYKMKRNPRKCIFRLESGKFLGFIVNHRGIEAH